MPACCRAFSCVLLLLAAIARGEEKIVLLDDLPQQLTSFEVTADGSRLLFGAGSFYIFDDRGALVDKLGCPAAGRELVPLADGSFLACIAHSQGMIARYRADGTLAAPVIERGPPPAKLRADGTGWTSPTGVAVDEARDRMFVCDVTMAPRDDRNLPDPDWSRIVIYDLAGKYLGQINAFDAYAADAKANDSRRTWYGDIEVDSARERVYVTSRRTQELIAFGYDGSEIARVPSPGNMLAVFPDGEVAVSGGNSDNGGPTIQIFSPDLKPTSTLEIANDERKLSFVDLETDRAGRLYASTADRRVTFVRWNAERTQHEQFGPRYRSIRVDFAEVPLVAGSQILAKVMAEGRPAPKKAAEWRVFARPTDGSSLQWQTLSASYRDGILTAVLPQGMIGPYEIAVRLGTGPIAWGDRARDLHLQKTVLVAPPGVDRSMSIITKSSRRSFRQGESIELSCVRRVAADVSTNRMVVNVSLERAGNTVLAGDIPLDRSGTATIPAVLTQRLPPGEYVLRPRIASHFCYQLRISIAQSDPDSPLQRIQYHEFDNEAITMRQIGLSDMPERLAYIRDYTDANRRLGFNRETDRLANKLNPEQGPVAWQREQGVGNENPALAPAEYWAIPPWHANWEAEKYLDEAVRTGIQYDTQLLGHCDGVKFRDYHLQRLCPLLDKTARWLDKYPSFYGFNYNDEMFFGGWAGNWNDEDNRWLADVKEKQFRGKPHADHLRYATRLMYEAFNKTVHEASPRLRTTATPMWQYPASEGSYAPDIYRGMSESYTHYLSEGYSYPWYPAHSVEFLRRRNLPLMGVFDNGYATEGGDLYVKNLMQVLSRGVQGAGTQHMRPYQDPWGASAMRVANEVAKRCGPIFAECPPLNEGAILYSYSQDVTENRNMMGTPHWERVFELHAAGMMAGVPLQVTYEEDLAAGTLLRDGKPVVPMLFLVGQTQPLQAEVTRAIEAFQLAGGKVLADLDSSLEYDRLPMRTHELKQLWHDGYAADTIFPLFQPVLEAQAKRLRDAVAQQLRFPLSTNDPWIGKTSFDGGAIRYVMVTAETSPYPWDAGTLWSLGGMYCKQKQTLLPKRASLTLPPHAGVVYDVFSGGVVPNQSDDSTKATLPVDLRTFPAQLFAISPATLGAPQLVVNLQGGTAKYEVRIVDAAGQPLAARVPLRIRLADGDATLHEQFLATSADGSLSGSLALPAFGKQCVLEVTSLVGGLGARVELPVTSLAGDLFTPVETVAVNQTVRGQANELRLAALPQPVGIPLTGIKASADGSHLLVTADGYLKNAALIAVSDEKPQVVFSERIGDGPTVGSAFLNHDGTKVGVANRVRSREGEGFFLFDSQSKTRDNFAVFGDLGRSQHQFAATDDGQTVIVPGTYGAVCWQRAGENKWKELWAIDYWKSFAKLDWPVSAEAERQPQFHAVIPRGADYGLILFGEFSNNGWVKPEYPCSAKLTAVNLADGGERWSFEVPIPKTLLFPKLYTSPDGRRLLLHVQMGSWGSETHRYYVLRDGKVIGSWDTGKDMAPLDVAISDVTGAMAILYKQRLLEIRQSDGALVHNELWPSQPLSSAFLEEGQRIAISDDAEQLSLIDLSGSRVWQQSLGTVTRVATAKDRIYVAGWDGFVRAFDAAGSPLWKLSCDAALNAADPAKLLAHSDSLAYHVPPRVSTTLPNVPDGENLLRSGKATLTVGGTGGWMSNGVVQVKPEELTSGKADDIAQPWLNLDEIFWNAISGRQVWAEITFAEPTAVNAVTVREHPDHPESWPTEGLVQVWREDEKCWQTAAFGVFLSGPVNTYSLDLKSVSKLRYLPWSSYYRNFWTSEIEVR